MDVDKYEIKTINDLKMKNKELCEQYWKMGWIILDMQLLWILIVAELWLNKENERNRLRKHLEIKKIIKNRED